MDRSCAVRMLWISGLIILLSPLSFAETTCTKGDCELAITLKIAFSGASDDYISRAEKEIEDTWNGPDGFRTVGDCKCPMTFDVVTMKITDASQVNCNPGPPGYHCVMVTDYFKPDGSYANPPRNQSDLQGASFYMGYMYGVANGNGGNSQNGWWSDQMSRPVDPDNPGGEHYKDFAHEAGHMMGLEDGDGGIMSRTSGAGSEPTQANLDEIADDICGADACPDRCCCGNGQIEAGKGEGCDPFAEPTGCGSGASCCPVCCSCFAPLCIAADGEYLDQASCQDSCGADSACYKNYQTGCWDCVKQTVVIEDTCRDPANIRGNLECDHAIRSFVERSAGFYEEDLVDAPFIGGFFSDERINIETAEGDGGYLVTKGGAVTDYGEGALGDPTVTVRTDRMTMSLLASEDMSIQQALSAGRIDVDGEGLFNGIRFGFYNIMFGLYDALSPAGEFVEPVPEEGLPPEYRDVVQEIVYSEPGPEDPKPGEIGELPDGGYFGGSYHPTIEP
ncbi:MAG: hypothetical protein AB1295_03315 [Candidatus Micrarchaeota archaeon]